MPSGPVTKDVRLVVVVLDVASVLAVFPQDGGVSLAVCAFAVVGPCPLSAGASLGASPPSELRALLVGEAALAPAIADEKLALSLGPSVAAGEEGSCR